MCQPGDIGADAGVYVAAFGLDEGESLGALLGGQRPGAVAEPLGGTSPR
jgi:hypothetical protein